MLDFWRAWATLRTHEIWELPIHSINHPICFLLIFEFNFAYELRIHESMKQIIASSRKRRTKKTATTDKMHNQISVGNEKVHFSFHSMEKLSHFAFAFSSSNSTWEDLLLQLHRRARKQWQIEVPASITHTIYHNKWTIHQRKEE